MTPAVFGAWVEVGAKLVTVLGVPILEIIKLFKGQGGTDAEALELIGKWRGLVTDVQARIALLQAEIALLEAQPK